MIVAEISGNHNGDLDIPAEEVAGALLHHRNGAITTIHLDYLQQPPYRSCTVIGTQGRHTWHYKGAGSMYEAEMRHFLDCIRGGKEPMNNLKEATEVLKVALEVRNGRQER